MLRRHIFTTPIYILFFFKLFFTLLDSSNYGNNLECYLYYTKT